MMILPAFLTVAYMAWAATSAVPPVPPATNLAENPLAPPPPSKDPFYTVPPDYEEAAPGDVLRIRNAPGLSQAVANSSAAYNILYRTTDGNYQPSWAVTTLFIPQAANSSNTTINSTVQASGSILLSFQLAYDSANVDMSPSYTFYGYPVDPSIIDALGQGWYVNVPDYEGPLASFVNGVQSGHATIDSVRAALNSGFGLRSDARCALWGYSGGALASEFAAELQVQYASELNFSAVVLGGASPNVTSAIFAMSGTPFAEDAVNGILGLISQNATAQAYVKSQLSDSGPYNSSTFYIPLTANTSTDATVFANQNIFNYFRSAKALVTSPLLQELVNTKATWGYHGVPAMPVFFYKAIGDELSPVADTDALVERYCEVGANILYQRNSVGGHLAEYYNGLPAATAFVTAALDGTFAQKYQTTGCTVQNVTISIDPSPE